jgi:hypothetical protein
MSHGSVDTVRPLTTPIGQRHLKAEVANCVGGVITPLLAVEIPKAGGKGVRVLGVPTVADRIAQTVVKMYLESKVEPIFHPDSYGTGQASPRWTRSGHAECDVGEPTG